MHHGSGAKLQEEEGHVVLHQREKLHVSSEQPAVPVHGERLLLVSERLHVVVRPKYLTFTKKSKKL